MIYVDTSAFVKLVWAEEGTEALQAYLASNPGATLVSSTLLAVEARRAVLRVDPTQLPRTDLLLSRVGQVSMGHAVVEAASRYPDPLLRSLDAIHLSTALMLREEIDALVTYDHRLAGAATSSGIRVESPGS